MEELGFKTEKSLNYVYECADHHKTWRLMELLLFAVTDEILHLYTSQTNEYSVDGFWNWLHTNDAFSQNFVYGHQMTFHLLFAIILFRVSVRRNCYKGISRSRKK